MGAFLLVGLPAGIVCVRERVRPLLKPLLNNLIGLTRHTDRLRKFQYNIDIIAINVVPGAGFEPARSLLRGILNPSKELPYPLQSNELYYIIIIFQCVKIYF